MGGGEPTESEEVRPQRFKMRELPFDSMWLDDPHWLPKVLEGLLLEAAFLTLLPQNFLTPPQDQEY